MAAALPLVAQSAPAGPQNTRIDAADARAQHIINRMPPGANRTAAQRGLDNFRRMRAAGRVRISPDPGYPLTPGGAPVRTVPNPHNAFTTAEWVIPGGGGGGGGGGESGGTGEVGAGNEFTNLGGVPDGNPGGRGGSVGSPSGDNLNTDDPAALGGKLIHEGLRAGQDWSGDGSGNPRNSSEVCQKENNEYEVYLTQAAYFAAAIQVAEDESDTDGVQMYSNLRKKRLARAQQALVRRSNAACS